MISSWQLRKWLAREVLGRDIGRKPPARERRGPERNAAYLRWIRQQPCAACHVEGRSEAAHCGGRGLSQKAADTQAIPLCADCHTRGPRAYHRLGRAAFERAHRLDCAAVAERLHAEWRRRAA
jgi:hypothetical protein